MEAIKVLHSLKDLEKELNIYSRRIEIFGEFVEGGSVDIRLIKKCKYILEKYYHFLQTQEDEVESMVSTKISESVALKTSKKRISHYKGIFSDLFQKLAIIEKVYVEQQNISTHFEEVKVLKETVDITSAQQIIYLQAIVKKIQVLHNDNQKIQKKLGFSIYVNDEFEQQAEKKEALIVLEEQYIFVQNINRLLGSYKNYTEEIKDILQKGAKENFPPFRGFQKGFGQNIDRYFQKLEKKYVKKQYELVNYDIYISDFYKDFSELLDICICLKDSIKNIYNICENYSSFLGFGKRFGRLGIKIPKIINRFYERIGEDIQRDDLDFFEFTEIFFKKYPLHISLQYNSLLYNYIDFYTVYESVYFADDIGIGIFDFFKDIFGDRDIFEPIIRRSLEKKSLLIHEHILNLSEQDIQEIITLLEKESQEIRNFYKSYHQLRLSINNIHYSRTREQ